MSDNVYSYAVIIGIDGMGGFNKEAATPCMDEIFKNGAVTYRALSMYPTISAQNWGSMLIGMNPEIHCMTNNSVGQKHNEDENLPSLFSRVRKAFPDAFLASCCNWNPINYGIIEQNIGVEMHTAGEDEELCDIIEEVISRKPKLLFIQFDSCDEAGHAYGYGTEKHLKQIEAVDALCGRIYEAYKKAGIAGDTLFAALADHGGENQSHGAYSDTEKYVGFALAGKTVNKCEIPFAQTKDINSVVLHAFGLDLPEYDYMGYSSQIPQGVFSDCDMPYVKTEGKPFYVHHEETPGLNAPDGLLSFFNEDDFKFAMFFDNDAKDDLGRVNFKRHGQVKFYSEGRYGSMGEVGAIGWLSSDEVSFGFDDFSIAVWIKIEPSLGGNCYICGTKAMRADSRGFMLSETVSGSVFSLENDDHETYEEFITPFFDTVSSGWIHVIVSFDRKQRKLCIYHNFELKRSIDIDPCYDCSMDNLPFTIGNECSFKGNNIFHRNIYNLDDLLVFGRALGAEDVKKLAKYYKM